MVTRPRKIYDWRRLCVIAAIGMMISAFCMGSLWKSSFEKSLPGLLQASREYTAREKKLSNIRKQIVTEKKLQALIQNNQRVDAVCLRVLDALPEALGYRTRILYFRSGPGLVEIKGETHDPGELTALRKRLGETVDSLGWQVEERQIDSRRSTGKWTFNYRIIRETP